MVDIAEPLAQILRAYVGGNAGYLFSAGNGRSLDQRNVLRALHATGKRVGLHAFRRFRTETLRRARVPEDLIKLWLGHSKQTITDFYAMGLERDETWGRDWCERSRLGYLGHKMKSKPILRKQRKPNAGQKIEWRARRESNSRPSGS